MIFLFYFILFNFFFQKIANQIHTAESNVKTIITNFQTNQLGRFCLWYVSFCFSFNRNTSSNVTQIVQLFASIDRFHWLTDLD